MTREEAKRLGEVMLAYAEGKEIEFSLKHKNIWYTHDGDTVSDGKKIIHSLEFNFEKFDYRIKPEPTYRPFKNKEECWAEMQKHQPFGWLIDKNTDLYHSIVVLNNICPYFSSGYGDEYEHLFEYESFYDGTPFGIKEE